MPLSRVKPENYETLLSQKVEAVADLMSAFLPPPPIVYPSQRTGFRLRAEFSMWHDDDDINFVMFRREDPKTPVILTEFPIGHILIQQSMPVLRNFLRASSALRYKLFQTEFLVSLSGDLLVTLVYHRKLNEAWENIVQLLLAELQPLARSISIIGRSRKQKLVVGSDFVRECLPIHGELYHYRQYEQCFSQPNGRVNIAMIEWACERARGLGGDLLELYCGNGNFTIPLSRHFAHVIATEQSKTSTHAARANLTENNVQNVLLVRLSAEEVVEAMQGQRVFRRLRDLPKPLDQFRLESLFVDPPRAGLDDHTLRMASQFPTVMYVSCNPYTLAQNMEVLHKTHEIENFALFDQFPYTDHIECGVLLQRR